MERRSPSSVDRRPIAARQSGWAQAVTAFLARRGVSPNAISWMGLAFAVGAAGSLWATTKTGGQPVWWWLAAALIVLRLLANMFDGMVAVATGRSSPLGTVFNEVPDRIADGLILVSAGFAQGSSPHAGYWAALLAVFVAYLRAFGNTLGVTGLFLGPMAKSQRMFTLAALCLAQAVLPAAWRPPQLLAWGLAFIALGSGVTALRRLRRIVQEVSP